MPGRRKRTVVLPATRSPIKKTLKEVPCGADSDEISTWVQCESKTCLKWRRITRDEADSLGEEEPWNCWMNRDARYNKCTAREEKAKKPKHMKFVYSLLPMGEVVMARMSGYPPWPGLLTLDPSCDEYYDAPLAKEHDITHYHVEFLGTPRSHAWVVANLVHPFSSVPDVDKCPQFKNIQGRKLVEIKRSFDKALIEARQLSKKTLTQRLATCQFKASESDEQIGDVQFTAEKDSESVKQPKKRGRKRKISHRGRHEEIQCEQTVPQRSVSPTATLFTDQCDQLPIRGILGVRRSSVSFNSDCVPSSNPDSPLDLTVEFSSDSEDESSTTLCCDLAERELQRLETLLTALEPSLYPRSGEEESSKARQTRRSPVLTASCRNIGQEEVDVTRTLDEIAEIEEEIAQLDTFVAIGLDQL